MTVFHLPAAGRVRAAISDQYHWRRELVVVSYSHLLAIVHMFSGRLHGLRRYEKKITADIMKAARS